MEAQAMSRLMTDEQDAHWSGNGLSFDPRKLQVVCGPMDDKRRRVVIASLYGVTHRDCFDTDIDFLRQKFREKCQHKFSIDDPDFQAALEAEILAKADAADARAESEPLIQCSTIRLSDVEPEQVEWLWRERIAIGKLTLLVGDPGQGKSFLTLDIASRISRGASWPDSPKQSQPAGDVILLGAEDALGDTVRPRLDAHGADVTRIIAIRGTRFIDDADDQERMVNLVTDLDSIRRVIQSANEPRAVIIDPVSAYLGKTDSHKNAEVRAVLAPLATLASELRVAVIAVSHLRKGEGAALYRTMGSLAFIAAARSAWVVCKDAADPKRRLMLPLKSNIAPDIGGLAFAILPHGPDGAPVVCWEAKPVTEAADDVIGEKRRKPGPEATECEAAADWLREQLANGPRAAKAILEDGKADGFSRSTLYRAFKVVGAMSKIGGFPACAHWSIPGCLSSCTDAIRHRKPDTPGTTEMTALIPEEEEEATKFLSNGRAVVSSSKSMEHLNGFDIDGANEGEPF
jgi:hypothetical protein